MNRTARSAVVFVALGMMAAVPTGVLAADSLNMRTVGRWPFGGESVAVGDETRQLVFCGSSGGVYILDASNPESLRVVSERIQTRGIVQDLFYDDANRRLYVACGEGGLEIWDVTTPASPWRPGFFAGADHAHSVTVSGDYAYLADRDSGLRVISVANPANPYQASRLDTPGDAVDVAVQGQYAYIADSASIRVVDISVPANPREVGHCDSTRARGIEVSGQYAYVAGSGLQVVSIVDPAHPYKMGFCPVPSTAVDVALAGSYAYVSDKSYGMIIVEVSNPQAPTRVGSLYQVGRYNVKVSGTHAYAIVWGLSILDVTDPRTPFSIGWFLAPASVYGGVAVCGDYAYLTDDYKGVLVIDISDPVAAHEVARCETIGGSVDVVADGEYVYTGNTGGGIWVIDASDPASPRPVGQIGTQGVVERLAVSGSLLCAAEQMAGVPLIDVSTPACPRLVGRFANPGFAYGVAISDSWLYVADAWEGMWVVRISDPANPTAVGNYRTRSADDVAVAGHLVFVAARHDGLRVVDVAEPQRPTEIGSCLTPGSAYSVAVRWPYAYVACDSGGLRMIEVSDPSHPREVGFVSRAGAKRGIAVQGNRIFLADGGTGLNILENLLYGITENDAHDVGSTGWRVLDNPVSNGSLRIAVPESPGQAASFCVFDIAGRAVSRYAVHALGQPSLGIPVRSLPPGSYVLRVSTSGRSQYLKFVVTAGPN